MLTLLVKQTTNEKESKISQRNNLIKIYYEKSTENYKMLQLIITKRRRTYKMTHNNITPFRYVEVDRSLCGS